MVRIRIHHWQTPQKKTKTAQKKTHTVATAAERATLIALAYANSRNRLHAIIENLAFTLLCAQFFKKNPNTEANTSEPTLETLFGVHL